MAIMIKGFKSIGRFRGARPDNFWQMRTGPHAEARQIASYMSPTLLAQTFTRTQS